MAGPKGNPRFQVFCQNAFGKKEASKARIYQLVFSIFVKYCLSFSSLLFTKKCREVVASLLLEYFSFSQPQKRRNTKHEIHDELSISARWSCSFHTLNKERREVAINHIYYRKGEDIAPLWKRGEKKLIYEIVKDSRRGRIFFSTFFFLSLSSLPPPVSHKRFIKQRRAGVS